MMNFSDFKLSEKLIKNITALGYKQPTPIQEKSIPLLLQSQNDFVGQAQTGTGKTAAFVLPLLQRINPNKRGIQALILSPTRELAKQIQQQIQNFSLNLGIRSTLVYGGTSYSIQISDIKNNQPSIIVGTPGRIIDLMEQKILRFDQSDFLVLDEADEMLQMGFWDEVEQVLEKFNPHRKIWMFSATMPDNISRMIHTKFNKPEIVRATPNQEQTELVEHFYCLVENKKRLDALYLLIMSEQVQSAMVFCKTKALTQEVTEKLHQHGVRVDMLNGDMSQSQREITMTRFKSGKTAVLVCTDVASRGIDVKDLTHVFNFSLPHDLDSYVHRIGRTGRAGQKGIAWNILSPSEMGFIRRLEKFKKIKIEKKSLPSAEEIKTKLVQSQCEKLLVDIESLKDGDQKRFEASSYKLYKDVMEHVKHEDLLKLIYNLQFNKNMQQFKDVGEAKDNHSFKDEGNGRRPRRSSHNRRGFKSRRSGGGGFKSGGRREYH